MLQHLLASTSIIGDAALNTFQSYCCHYMKGVGVEVCGVF